MSKYRVSRNISREKFVGMLAGKKHSSGVPTKIAKALRDAGKSNILTQDSVHPDEAVDIVKYLVKKKLLYGPNPHALVRRVKKEQDKEDEEEKKKKEEQEAKEKQEKEEAENETRKRHIKGRIGLENVEDAIAEEEGRSEINYPEASVLGQTQQRDQSKKGRVDLDQTEKRVDINKLAHKKQKLPSQEDIKNLPEMF